MVRDIDTQGGNYAEQVVGNNIHAQTVNFFGPQPLTPQPIPPTCHEKSSEKRKQIAFVIDGSLKDSDPTKLAKLQAHVRAIQQLTGDASLTVFDILEGSIRLILEGSEAGVDRLQELFDSGELTEILGVSVIAVEPVAVEAVSVDPSSTDQLKEILITTIATQGAQGCDLSEANLSGADLRGANLSGATLNRANLSGADLIKVVLIFGHLNRTNLRRANLSGADLRANFSRADLSFANLSRTEMGEAQLIGAQLIGADLRGANLRGADLRGTDLREANLNGTNLSKTNFDGANVEGAIFTQSRGLSKTDRVDLQARGAIFNDSPGDRSRTLIPVDR